MSDLGKEKIFFIATLLILGIMTYSLVTTPHVPVKAPGGKKPDPELLARVDVPWSPRDAIANGEWVDLERDPFLEPRDWLPLPAASLPRPPVSEPAQVPPFPFPALGMDHRGQYRVVAKTAGHEFAEGAGTEASVPSGAADLTDGGTNGARAAAPDDGATLDQDFRRRFDWLEYVGSSRPIYGILLNEDKYTLHERLGEDIQFRQIDPETNRLLAEGTIPRAQVKDNGIHLADTAVNRVERKILEIPEDTWNVGAIPRLVKNIREVMAEGAVDPYAWERAAEELTKYQQIDPLSPMVYELLADCNRHLFDFEAELATLLAADKAGVSSAGLVTRRARWNWRYGARAHALDLLTEGVLHDSVNRELRLFRGQCFLEEGMGDEARQEFEAAEQASSTPAERREVLRMFGEALLSIGDPAGALTQAERIFAIDADDSEGLGLAGAAHYALGQYDEAASAYGRLLEVADNPALNAKALLGQGLSMIHQGQYDAARNRLTRAGQENPLIQAQAEAGLAFLYEVTESPSDALEHALAAVTMAPDDPSMHYMVGRQLRLAGDLEGAQTELRKALALGATFSDLFNELGYLSMLQDQSADAVRYLEESLQREDRTETQNLLGHAQLVGNDLTRARNTFAGGRNSSETFAGLGFCDYMGGKSAEAQDRFNTILNDMDNARPQDKAYAQAALDEILDRESKERWEDLIRWRQVGNGWTVEERFGIGPRVTPGSVRLKGTQRAGSSEDDWTYLQRPLELATFHELEMDLTIDPANQGRVGMALVAWGRGVGQVPRARTALGIAVDEDGTLRIQKRENLDDPRATWNQAGSLSTIAGESFTVTLRRSEQGSDRFQFLVDGAAVGEEIEMPPWRGKRKQQLFALFFVVADSGRKVEASMTAARMIRFRQ